MINQLKREKSFGLIGNPLGHSLSPFIHRELMRAKGTDGDYMLLETDEKQLPVLYRERLQGMDGFNVTIPHKINIIPFLDSLSPEAALYGAVNTVTLSGGKATGYNTDCVGFRRALSAAGIALSGRVLVLGAGGVSRMFATECVLAGADVTVAVRQSGIIKAERLCEEICSKTDVRPALITLDEVSEAYGLIVNGTPVGMFPDLAASPLSAEAVERCDAVFDAIYNPFETSLLKLAKEYGLKYINGLPMLVWQAAAAQELWNGVVYTEAEVEQVIALTARVLEEK